VKPLEPFEIHRPVAAARPNWPAIAASVFLHALLIALLILRPAERQGVAPPPHRPDGSEPQPIAMPLQPFAKPKPKVATPPPPPPVREQILGPDSKNPNAAVPHEAIAPHPPADPATDPAGATKAPDPVPAETKSAPPDPVAPESRQSHFPSLGELLATQSRLAPPTSNDGPAKEIIDPNRGSDLPAPRTRATASANAMGRSGLSAEDNREWRPSFPDAAGSCAEIPELGKNPDGSPVLATVIGRVFEEDGVTPLADAHLQILGTAYTTFTDGRGVYRLEFDPHLLQKCRVQYVMVVAAGHQAQQLMLAIGRKVQSDDVRLRRR
jgi:hypothetical protein